MLTLFPLTPDVIHARFLVRRAFSRGDLATDAALGCSSRIKELRTKKQLALSFAVHEEFKCMIE